MCLTRNNSRSTMKLTIQGLCAATLCVGGALGTEAVIAAVLAAPITFGMKYLGYTTTYTETFVAIGIIMSLQTWRDIARASVDIYEGTFL